MPGSSVKAASASNPYATDFYADADKAQGVTSITIPATVESVDPAFFQLFPNAASVNVAEGNQHLTSYNGMLFGADDAKEPTDLLLVPEGMEGAAVLPVSLATVPACVITRCNKLSAIVFPKGSTAPTRLTARNGILYSENQNDSGEPDGTLTLLAAPPALGASASIAPECTQIAEGAFLGNDDLRTIIASGAIATIGAPLSASDDGSDATEDEPIPAFAEEALAEATVLTTERAAWEAAGFTHFAEPAEPGDATTLAKDESGFVYTLMEDGHLSVKWQGEAPASGTRTIVEKATLNGVDYTVTTIEDGAFRGQTELTELVLSGTITSIGASAFEGCTSLTTITIPASVRTIGARAFAGSGIAALTLPTSVAAIGDGAFAECPELKTLIALGEIAGISATALTGDTGLSIYTPYRADDAYAWSIGAPAAGNHLMPYGVKAAPDTINLKLGEMEQADIFQGGYLEAPGDIEVQTSYRSCVSVTDNRTVIAKQIGTTPVIATLTLDGRTIAAATANVAVAPADKVEVPVEDAKESEPEQDDLAAPEKPESEDGADSTDSADAQSEETSSEDGPSEETPIEDATIQDDVVNATSQPAVPEEAKITSTEEAIINDSLFIKKITAELPAEEKAKEANSAVKASDIKANAASAVARSLDRDSDTLNPAGTISFTFNGGGGTITKEILTKSDGKILTNTVRGENTKVYASNTCPSGTTHGVSGVSSSTGKTKHEEYRLVRDKTSDGWNARWRFVATDGCCVRVSAHRVGYRLIGWQIGNKPYKIAEASQNETIDYFKNPGSNAAVVCTALWEPYKATVTFDANGGTGSTTKAANFGSTIAVPTTTQTGYKFNGWYNEKSGGTQIIAPSTSSISANNANLLGSAPKADKTLTLYAQWSEYKTTITYKGMGATRGSMSDQVISGTKETAELEKNKYEKSGFRFTGWKDANSSNTYADGQTIKIDQSADQTISLEAQWVEQCDILYSSYGEWPPRATKTVDKGSRIFLSIPSANLDKTGLEVEGVTGATHIVRVNSDIRINNPTKPDSSIFQGWKLDGTTFSAQWASSIRISYLAASGSNQGQIAYVDMAKGSSVYISWFFSNALLDAEGWESGTSGYHKDMYISTVLPSLSEEGKKFVGYNRSGFIFTPVFTTDGAIVDANGGSFDNGTRTSIADVVAYTPANHRPEYGQAWRLENYPSLVPPAANSAGLQWSFAGWGNQDGSRSQFVNYEGVSELNGALRPAAYYTQGEIKSGSPYYAKWEGRITVKHDIPDKPDFAITLKYGASLSKFTANTPGYTLRGVYTDKTGGTMIFNSSGNAVNGFTAANIPATVYARYSPIASTVYFDGQGGEVGYISHTSVSYGTDAGSLIGECYGGVSKPGYKFLGFYDKRQVDSGTKKKYVSVEAPSAGSTAYRLVLANKWDKTADPVTLYAHWELIPLKIYLNQNCDDENAIPSNPDTIDTYYGGPLIPNSAEYQYISCPSRPGHSFEGYYLNKDGTGTQYYRPGVLSESPGLLYPGTGLTTCDLTEDTTLYAKWTPVEYGIFLTKGTGVKALSASMSKYTYSTSDQTFTVTATALAGYDASKLHISSNDAEFDTNNISGNGTATVTVTIPAGMAESLTLSGYLDAIPYKVELNTDGGAITDPAYKTETANQKYTREYTVTTATFRLPTPQKNNYTFNGWKKNNTGTANKTVDITKGTTEDRSYTADWTENNATLSFAAQAGGSVSPTSATISVVSGSASSTATADKDYKFTGWYDGATKITETSTSKNVYVSGTKLTVKGSSSAPLKAKTYTAHFEPIPYTITLNLHGGGTRPTTSTGLSSGVTIEGSGDGFITYNVKSDAFNVGKPVKKDGYEFVGWYATDSTSVPIDTAGHVSGQVYNDNWNVPKGSTGYVTLHAIWRSTIKLDVNAPKKPNTIIDADVDQKGVPELYYYTRVGGEFGYHTSDDLVADNLVGDKASKADYDKAIEKHTIDPYGWEFQGYYSQPTEGQTYIWGDGTFSQVAMTQHIPTANEIWYAQWAGKTFTVTLRSNMTWGGTWQRSFRITFGDETREHFTDDPHYYEPNDGARFTSYFLPNDHEAAFDTVGFYNTDNYQGIEYISRLTTDMSEKWQLEITRTWDIPADTTLYAIYNSMYFEDTFKQSASVPSSYVRTSVGKYALTGKLVEFNRQPDPGFHEKVDHSDRLISAMIPKPNDMVVLKRYYDRNVYTLTFDANPGKYPDDAVVDMPNPTNPSYKWEEQRAFSGVAPKRVGYEFKGWAFDKDAAEPDFDAAGLAKRTIEGADNKVLREGDTYKHIFLEDRTLYALWSPLQEDDGFYIRLHKFTGDHEASLVKGTRFDSPFAFGSLADDPVRVVLPEDLYEDTNKAEHQDDQTGNFPGYFLAGWTWLKDWRDADGNVVPASERSRYMLPFKTSVREIVIDKCGVTDPGVREVHLYAVWQVAYHVDVPTDERVDMVLDVSNKDTYRASDIMFTSTTPSPIYVSARSQALPAAEEVFSQTIGNSTKVTDFENVRFRFDMDGVSDRDAPRFAMDAAAYERAVDIGTIAASGTLVGRLSMYFNNKSEVYINPKVSASRIDGDDDEAGSRLDMNGTIWDDPIARISWQVALGDAMDPPTYTQFIDPPADEKPGYGEVSAEASRASRPDD